MTYLELKEILAGLNEEQLDQDVTLQDCWEDQADIDQCNGR